MVHGDVVYFVDGDRVGFGVLDDVFDGTAYVDLVELADHRYVDGIAIQYFHSETEWRKMPKGWTYNTELFKLEEIVPEAELARRRELRIDRPEDVKAALAEGFAVLAKENFHGVIEAEIDRHTGFRVVKRYPHWTYSYPHHNTPYRRFNAKDIYLSYNEAKTHLKGIQEARRAELALTDDEWSWKEIEKDLKRLEEPYMEHCRKFLGSLPDIWDVETKVVSGDMYWRMFEKKTEWKAIPKEVM